MRVAVLIPGVPRFCEPFDKFIKSLESYKIDWYFYLWNNNINQPEALFINPSWEYFIDKSWAYEKIKSNLPTNHSIISLELSDFSSVTYPEVLYLI